MAWIYELITKIMPIFSSTRIVWPRIFELLISSIEPLKRQNTPLSKCVLVFCHPPEGGSNFRSTATMKISLTVRLLHIARWQYIRRCVCECVTKHRKIEENIVTICIVDFPFIYNVIKITNARDRSGWRCGVARHHGNISFIYKFCGCYLHGWQRQSL